MIREELTSKFEVGNPQSKGRRNTKKRNHLMEAR